MVFEIGDFSFQVLTSFPRRRESIFFGILDSRLRGKDVLINIDS